LFDAPTTRGPPFTIVTSPLLLQIPVNLLLGRLPKPELLRKYSLERFEGVVQAVRLGHLRNLQDVRIFQISQTVVPTPTVHATHQHLFCLCTQELDKHQAFFMQWGIYLLLEKLKLVAYRNLFKRV
jgi:hypothetical protein